MDKDRRSAERNSVMLGAEPELVIQFYDRTTKATGFAVLDTLTHGITYGGVRVQPNVQWTDLALLARIGTIRYQLSRVGLGGARLGLDYDPTAPDFEEVMGRFLSALRPLLGSCLSLGPDLNISSQQLEKLLAENQLPTRIDAVQRHQGWPTERWALYQHLLMQKDDGYALREYQIPYSVAQGTIAMGTYLFHRRPTVAVVGSGQFGFQIARLLHKLDAVVVAIGGASAGVYSAGGLGTQILENGLNVGMSLDATHMFITHDECYSLPVDILVLASTTDALTVSNVGKVRASLVVEAAASSVSQNAETVLVAGGKLVLPSFTVTMGGVLVADAVLQGHVTDVPDVLAYMTRNVVNTVQEITRLASTLRISVREAGVRLAFHRWDMPVPPMIPSTTHVGPISEEPNEVF
jgi:glutamate dehydrogenase (NAD(P)+)